MKLEVHAIGNLKSNQPEAALIQDYSIRIKGMLRNLGFKSFDLKEHESKKGLTGSSLKLYETELLTDGYNDVLISLDETGKNISSQDFAKLLEKYKDNNIAACRFIIGGADGLDKSVLKKSDFVLSFGQLTWPHMLVRVMLCEQIYRGMTILSNHPYHKI